MNRLSSEDRARILHLLCEGNSIRATVRLTGASKNTIAKLLATAGQACMAYQDRVLVNLNCKRIEVDELWSFVGAKQKNVPEGKQDEMGDVWTWVAICAESKLVPAWYIGGRDSEAAMSFMDNLAKRLAQRIQLTSDGHKPYIEAVEGAFGADIDYAMLVKIYGPSPEGPQRRYSPAECLGAKKQRIEGKPDLSKVSTSYAERNNGIIRQHCKRYARLTQAFSKKIENHVYAFALHTMYHNFVKISGAHRMTPAMKVGVTGKLWEMPDLVAMIEEWEKAQTASDM
ncbi:MAG: IS1 family transposase [Proteobacteria bacterium]|nr:IS1 family transposase [Pseudomonadota bacterium]